MDETYDSILDRIGAFNLLTESMSKGRTPEVRVEVAGRTELGLRLVKSAENYSIEVNGAPASAAEALHGMGFKANGERFSREVRKSERSWNVASQLEDVLQDALQLGASVAIVVRTEPSP